MKNSRQRNQFLEKWTKKLRWHVAFAATKSRMEADRLVERGLVLRHIDPINGPRVAGLSIKVGKDAREIRRWLEAENFALIHQSIPHDDCPGMGHELGEPQTYWQAGRYVVTFPWSDEVAEKDIRTPDLLDRVKDIDVSTDWVVGLENSYQPTVFSLNDGPHWFAIGSTTSGKSTAIVNMVAQLARSESNRFVFIDTAKRGDGLGTIPFLKTAIGPPCWELEDAKGALSWLLGEMARRYNGGKDGKRIIVVIDEFPSLRDDNFAVDAIEKLTSQGAGADIHTILIAQHAIQSAIGKFAGIIKANVPSRLCFKCGTEQNSIQAIGDNRGMKLVPPGDCWAVHNKLPQPIRIQASYFTDSWLKENLNLGNPILSTWGNHHEPSNGGNGRHEFSIDERGVGLLAVVNGVGRPTLERALDKAGVGLGSTTSRRLLDESRALYRWLQSNGHDVVFSNTVECAWRTTQ